MSCRCRQSDAAYVLGALGPAERTAYESHLAQCAECATSVAKLTPIPGLLRRVDGEQLLTPPPVAGLAGAGAGGGAPGATGRLPRLLAALVAQRRRQAWWRRAQLATAAVAAAAVAATGTAVGVQPSDQPAAPPAAAVAMVPLVDGLPVTAQVATVPAAGGTEVWLACQYPAAESSGQARGFRLVAVAADGSTESLGSWLAGPGDEMTVTGMTRFTDELRRLELHSADGDRLLTYRLAE